MHNRTPEHLLSAPVLSAIATVRDAVSLSVRNGLATEEALAKFAHYLAKTEDALRTLRA